MFHLSIEDCQPWIVELILIIPPSQKSGHHPKLLPPWHRLFPCLALLIRPMQSRHRGRDHPISWYTHFLDIFPPCVLKLVGLINPHWHVTQATQKISKIHKSTTSAIPSTPFMWIVVFHQTWKPEILAFPGIMSFINHQKVKSRREFAHPRGASDGERPSCLPQALTSNSASHPNTVHRGDSRAGPHHSLKEYGWNGHCGSSESWSLVENKDRGARGIEWNSLDFFGVCFSFRF